MGKAKGKSRLRNLEGLVAKAEGGTMRPAGVDADERCGKEECDPCAGRYLGLRARR
jgi:hypothetical protein